MLEELMEKEIGSSRKVLGAVLLVSGCCIGAGMLGLPLVTIHAGFWPSLFAFVISWLFMSATGLLLLEANLGFGQGVHLMTLAEKTLGFKAKIIVAVLFAFLFYCLMVAYVAGGGALISDILNRYLGVAVNANVGGIILVVLFGFVVYLGSSGVDLVNRLFMVGLALAYGGLIILGVPHIKGSSLLVGSWKYALPAIPTTIISFGYHNLIPSLTDYLKGNVRHLRTAILVGSAIPLIVYIVWNSVILGLLPVERGVMFEEVNDGAMVTSILQEAIGDSYIVELLEAFAFFALITSFLAVALSFVDFLADGLAIKKSYWGSLFLVSIVLLPSLLCSLIFPGIFLTALNYAGAFGAVLLFGVFPIAMVWKGRYRTKQLTNPQLFGGKISLIILGVFAMSVFFMQLIIELNN
jgi:tyrosine-specific transport protein